jgi:hypothetical protein
MNPERKPRPETEVADFSEILSPTDGSEPPVIVGGQTGIWNFDFTRVWPVDELVSTGNAKISRWLQHRFPSDVS